MVGMGRYGTVMVPCRLPVPYRRRGSYYAGLVTEFVLREDTREPGDACLVAVPGRTAKAVSDGLRYGLRRMDPYGELRTFRWKGNAYLQRLYGGGA